VEGGRSTAARRDEAGAIVALGKYFVNLTNRHRITVQPHTSKEKTKGDKA
jgi:hypothetical protein